MEPVDKAIHKNNMLKFKNCTIDKNGKVIKDKNHKKVDLKPILDSQSSLKGETHHDPELNFDKIILT